MNIDMNSLMLGSIIATVIMVIGSAIMRRYE